METKPRENRCTNGPYQVAEPGVLYSNRILNNKRHALCHSIDVRNRGERAHSLKDTLLTKLLLLWESAIQV